jgi:hypothetical protein
MTVVSITCRSTSLKVVIGPDVKRQSDARRRRRRVLVPPYLVQKQNYMKEEQVLTYGLL